MNSNLSEDLKEVLGEIIVPEDMVNGVLVKVRMEQDGEEKIFGVFDGHIAYLDKDVTYDPYPLISKQELFDETNPLYTAIWEEIKKYRFYKFVIHGQVK
jgi:hypothetical protein